MKYEPLQDNKFYHIYNRGNNGENIFIEDRNYAFFLSLIQNYILPISEVHAYCLLKNHIHLLIKTLNFENKILYKSFSNLFNAYAKAINKAYDRNGSLFQDRFSRIQIKNDEHLKQLILYIHLNPLHHGCTTNFENYKYSSFNAMMSKAKTLLKRDDLLELFDDKSNFRYMHYKRQQAIFDKERIIFRIKTQGLTGFKNL